MEVLPPEDPDEGFPTTNWEDEDKEGFFDMVRNWVIEACKRILKECSCPECRGESSTHVNVVQEDWEEDEGYQFTTFDLAPLFVERMPIHIKGLCALAGCKGSEECMVLMSPLVKTIGRFALVLEVRTLSYEMERMAPTDKDGWEKAEEEVHKIITKAQALGI